MERKERLRIEAEYQKEMERKENEKKKNQLDMASYLL